MPCACQLVFGLFGLHETGPGPAPAPTGTRSTALLPHEADGRPGRGRPPPPPPPTPPRAAPVKTVQVGIAEDVYEALAAAADKAGQPIESVATEAIRKHLGM